MPVLYHFNLGTNVFTYDYTYASARYEANAFEIGMLAEVYAGDVRYPMNVRPMSDSDCGQNATLAIRLSERIFNSIFYCAHEAGRPTSHVYIVLCLSEVSAVESLSLQSR